jgi:hypothetical protein
MARNLFQLIQDIDKNVVSALDVASASAAEAIVKDLQDEGPQYSGHFANSWKILPGNVEIAATEPGSNAPQQIRRIKAGKTTGKQFLGRAFKKVKYTIGNTASYRAIAMDLEPGQFVRPDFDPIKTPVSYGSRDGEESFRWDVRGQGRDALSTAKRDWFLSYLDGGGFDARFKFVVGEKLRQGGFK